MGKSESQRRQPAMQCMECLKRFYTVGSAERAQMNGCPKCGGVDIDLPDDQISKWAEAQLREAT